MITATNRKYFLNPLQDPYMKSDKVYVFRERIERGRSMDRILDVKNRHMYDSHLWFTTEAGDYVDGAPVSAANITTYQPMMGIISDDLFVIGTGTGVGSDGRMRIERARRSDGKALPDGQGGTMNASYAVDTWLQAASWAWECMPQPGDSAGTVAQRVEIAEKKFRTRLAEVCVLREAQSRGWTADLEDLDYTLPTPTYGLHVTGEVFIPSGAQQDVSAMPASEREKLEAVVKNSLGNPARPTRISTQVAVPVEFLVRSALPSLEDAERVQNYTLLNAAREQLGVPATALFPVSTQPLLRSAS